MSKEDLEIETVVPQAGPASFRALWREVRGQGGKIDLILQLLSKDPLKPDSKDGLVQKQEAQAREIDTLKERTGKLETRMDAHDQGDKTATEKRQDWLKGVLWDLAKLAGAAGLGSWLGKGAPH